MNQEIVNGFSWTVVGKNIGDVLVLLPPFEDSPVEVVFVEVTREDIDRLILLQEW